MFRLVAPLVLLLAWGGVARADGGYPWIGVQIRDDDGAVLVERVEQDAPAERAGVQAGDLILAVDDEATATAEALIRAVRSHRVGEEVKLHLVRDDRKVSLAMVLEPRPGEGKLVRKHLVGKAAPGFDLPALGRKGRVALHKLGGQVVVLEFWATWCGFCKAIHPQLAKLQREAKDLTVLAISNEDAEVLRAYLKEHELGITALSDTDRRVTGEYRVRNLPTVVVIDREGIVRYAGVGGPEAMHALEVARKLARDEQP